MMMMMMMMRPDLGWISYDACNGEVWTFENCSSTLGRILREFTWHTIYSK